LLPSILLYLASSGWFADWLANLLSVDDDHLRGKENEGILIA
jgi:hypothetical protein